MILFRIVGLCALCYFVYVLENSFLFDIHHNAEEHCITIHSLLSEKYDIYIEHPLYIVTLLIATVVVYMIGKMLDTSLGLVSVVGIGSVAGYFFFFT